jgi:hypothetical protein
VRPGSLRPALRRGLLLAAAWDPVVGGAACCREGRCVAWESLVGRTGSGRIGYGHTSVWPPVYRVTPPRF